MLQESKENDKRYQSEKFLRRKYVEEGLSAPEIADLEGVSKDTIYNWLRKNDIEVKCGEDRLYHDRTWLQEKHHDEGYPIAQMAELADSCHNTIRSWMEKLDVDIRPVEGRTKENDKGIAEMSESLSGNDHYWSGEKRPDHSERMSGRKNPMYGKSPEMSGRIIVDETGNEVLSSYEEDVDLLLNSLNIDYEYEPRSFELNGWTYTPDFISGNTVIEVKGRLWRDGVAKEKAEQFMKMYPDKEYVVVGTELPADTHIEWDERNKLNEVLS